VTAAQDTAAWPNNPQTATMQKALGTAISSVISGQSKPDEAAQSAQKAIDDARQKGGGGC
jgi:multiple sugar transport system substrate-binding protein